MPHPREEPPATIEALISARVPVHAADAEGMRESAGKVVRRRVSKEETLLVPRRGRVGPDVDSVRRSGLTNNPGQDVLGSPGFSATGIMRSQGAATDKVLGASTNGPRHPASS